jgi:hypothetical protein
MNEGFTVSSTDRLTGNLARVRRYRTLHRRIDYVPSPDVLPIIQHHLKIGRDRYLAGVIDYLIRSGHQAITGNGGK